MIGQHEWLHQGRLSQISTSDIDREKPGFIMTKTMSSVGLAIFIKNALNCSFGRPEFFLVFPNISVKCRAEFWMSSNILPECRMSRWKKGQCRVSEKGLHGALNDFSGSEYLGFCVFHSQKILHFKKKYLTPMYIIISVSFLSLFSWMDWLNAGKTLVFKCNWPRWCPLHSAGYHLSELP